MPMHTGSLGQTGTFASFGTTVKGLTLLARNARGDGLDWRCVLDRARHRPRRRCDANVDGECIIVDGGATGQLHPVCLQVIALAVCRVACLSKLRSRESVTAQLLASKPDSDKEPDHGTPQKHAALM